MPRLQRKSLSRNQFRLSLEYSSRGIAGQRTETESETLQIRCEEPRHAIAQSNRDAAAVDFGQVRHDGELEPAIVTAGDDASQVFKFVPAGRTSYSADDVIDRLLDWPAAR